MIYLYNSSMDNLTFFHIQNKAYVKNTYKLIEAEYLKDNASQKKLSDQ